jgi:hypothetical protein
VVTGNCPHKVTAAYLLVYAPDQFAANTAFWSLPACNAKGQKNFLRIRVIGPGSVLQVIAADQCHWGSLWPARRAGRAGAEFACFPAAWPLPADVHGHAAEVVEALSGDELLVDVGAVEPGPADAV